MWMAVLKKEMYGYKAGSMFAVNRIENGTITARYLDVTHTPPIFKHDHGNLVLSVDSARDNFTKPTKDLTDLMEESIMVCESVYC